MARLVSWSTEPPACASTNGVRSFCHVPSGWSRSKTDRSCATWACRKPATWVAVYAVPPPPRSLLAMEVRASACTGSDPYLYELLVLDAAGLLGGDALGRALGDARTVGVECLHQPDCGAPVKGSHLLHGSPRLQPDYPHAAEGIPEVQRAVELGLLEHLDERGLVGGAGHEVRDINQVGRLQPVADGAGRGAEQLDGLLLDVARDAGGLLDYQRGVVRRSIALDVQHSGEGCGGDRLVGARG